MHVNENKIIKEIPNKGQLFQKTQETIGRLQNRSRKDYNSLCKIITNVTIILCWYWQ